jgi:hypothetical protein
LKSKDIVVRFPLEIQPLEGKFGKPDIKTAWKKCFTPAWIARKKANLIKR